MTSKRGALLGALMVAAVHGIWSDNARQTLMTS
jgi:hypothetical protein